MFQLTKGNVFFFSQLNAGKRINPVSFCARHRGLAATRFPAYALTQTLKTVPHFDGILGGL